MKIEIETIKLLSGAHAGPENGFCVMEMSSYMAGEPWSDHPACVSPILGAFLRSWNDSLDDDTRQKLKPYAAKVIGTAGDGKDEQRAWMAVDWMSRTYLPVWLDLAGLSGHAAAVRAVIAITDPISANSAQPVLDAARAAAGDAAWDAAGDAARDAARAVQVVLAAAALRRMLPDAAWDAAWDAARAALQPSVIALQQSAFELLDRMITL